MNHAYEVYVLVDGTENKLLKQTEELLTSQEIEDLRDTYAKEYNVEKDFVLIKKSK